MSRELRLTILYEEGEDGWIVARVRELPAAMSQGRTREEARENVLDALSELAASYLADDEPIPQNGQAEPVEVTIR